MSFSFNILTYQHYLNESIEIRNSFSFLLTSFRSNSEWYALQLFYFSRDANASFLDVIHTINFSADSIFVFQADGATSTNISLGGVPADMCNER